MFSVLGGVEDFAAWITNGPLGMIFLNPLVLSIFVCMVVVVLYIRYGPESESEDPDSDLTRFTFYSFIAILVPILINNNVIDRKRGTDNYGDIVMSEDDF